ncbi:MAG: aminotransferase class IV, partial [Mucinivorans sp.]
MKTVSYSVYLEQLLAAPRPGAANILAFYEHRVGGICTDARLMLAPLDDHLCHRGDGVFESINYRQRRMLQLDAHMDRMVNSAASLTITPPCPWGEIRATILDVAAAGGEAVGAIRVLLGRGPGGFGISPTECPTASLYIVAMRSHIPD